MAQRWVEPNPGDAEQAQAGEGEHGAEDVEPLVEPCAPREAPGGEQAGEAMEDNRHGKYAHAGGPEGEAGPRLHRRREQGEQEGSHPRGSRPLAGPCPGSRTGSTRMVNSRSRSSSA